MIWITNSIDPAEIEAFVLAVSGKRIVLLSTPFGKRGFF